MKQIFLLLARQAIEEVLYDKVLIDKKALVAQYPELEEKGATFVTLTRNGALRGCIGSLVAHRTLIDDLVSNARSAAFKDPRFTPLSLEEFATVKIEVSLLSTPKSLLYNTTAELKDKIVTGVDGVVLSTMGRRATFLPQVWEELPTFELFFSQLCQKAGLASNCLEHHPKIEIYHVDKIKEGDDEE